MLICNECGCKFERYANRGPVPVFCRPCKKLRKSRRTDDWHKANPERVRAHKGRNDPVPEPACTACGKVFQRKTMHGNIPKWCPGCKAARERERQKRSMRLRTLAKYGLTPEQYDALLEAQGNICAICKTDQWGAKGPHIDHCHITGKVRGLLCAYCNVGIGNLRDDPALIAAALDYVLKGRSGEYSAAGGRDEVVLP